MPCACMVMVMVPSPLSTIVWSRPLSANLRVKVPPVARLVVTTVAFTFSTKNGNGPDPRRLPSTWKWTVPSSRAGVSGGALHVDASGASALWVGCRGRAGLSGRVGAA